jgi:hypothetical protein
VRIPIPIVIISVAAVTGGAWWHGTRDKDFPESATTSSYERVSNEANSNGHAAAALTLPEPEETRESEAPPPPVPVPSLEPGKPPEKPIEPPPLDLYRETISPIATELIRISHDHEVKGEIAAALLAAERVIDSAESDNEQTHQSIEIIQRLRPQVLEENFIPYKALPVTLYASTGRSNAQLVEPHLQELAGEIESASCGILRVSIHLTEGKDVPDYIGSPPVAIWFAGADGLGKSTQTLVFSASTEDSLTEKLSEAVLNLLRSNIERTASLKIPESEMNGDEQIHPLHYQITRLVWRELGQNLNSAAD